MNEVSTQTLHVVARELGNELNETRAVLELFGDRQDEVELLHKCRHHLHQVRGALRVTEIFGAALLVEEMEQLTKYLIDHFAEKRHLTEGLDALMRSIVQLPTYLDRVLSGGPDMALVLLPLLNDLRAVRGNPLLSEGTLLLLNLSSDEPARPIEPAPGEKNLSVTYWARKMRTRFQLGLLGWIKGERVDQNLEILALAAEKLEHIATMQPVFQLWWVVGAVVEALRAAGLEGGASIKRLLGQADREIRRLYELGEAQYASKPPLDLLNNLLYYVGRATSTGPRVTAVRSSFRLGELLPVDEQVEAARESLSAPSAKLMRTVAGAIKEDLAHIKDALDLFARKENPHISELAPQLELLKKIGDTLGVLGLGELREQVKAQSAHLQAVLQVEGAIEEKSLFGMAATLISIEDSLDDQLVGLVNAATRPAVASTTDTSDAAEFRQVTEAVLRECIVNMARIKEAIALAIEKPQDLLVLEPIPQLVQGISAGLLLLGKERAKQIIDRIGGALSSYARTRQTVVSECMDRLADAIVALEYYMETLQAGRSDPWYMLDNAEQCLAALDVLNSQAATRMPTVPATQQTTINEPTQVLGDRPYPTQVLDATVALPPALVLPADKTDPEFLLLFIEEARDEVQKLQQFLPSWEDDPNNQEALVGMRRSFHTLKGSGRLVGAQLIGAMAWSIENMLNRVINKTLNRSAEMMTVLHQAVAVLPELIEQLEIGGATPGAVSNIIAHAQALTADHAATVGNVATVVMGGLGVSETPVQAEVVVQMDPALHEIFSKEVRGHLMLIRHYINACAATEPPYTVTEQLHRACHTLSGATKTAGARQGIKVAEPLNHYIRKLFDNDVPLSAEGLTALQDATAAIETVITHINENTGYFVSQASIIDRLQRLEARLDEDMSRLNVSDDVNADSGISEKVSTGVTELTLDEFDSAIQSVSPSLESTLSMSFTFEGDSETEKTAEVVLSDESTAESDLTVAAMTNTEPAFESEFESEIEIEITSEPELESEPEPVVTTPIAQVLRAPSVEQVDERDSEDDAAFDPDVAAIFIEEATELLEVSQSALSSWQADRNNKAQAFELKRALHTLKGGARMAGIHAMGALGHELESFMESMEVSNHLPDTSVFELIQISIDTLHAMRDAVQNQQRPVAARELIARIRALSRGETQPVTPVSVAAAPEPVITEVTAEYLPDDLDASVRTTAATTQATVDSSTHRATAEATVPISVAASTARATPPDVPALPGREPQAQERGEVARVDAELLDTLLNNAGEVSILRSRLEQQVTLLDFNLHELDRVVTRLKDQLRKLELETEAQILHKYQDEKQSRQDFDPLELDRYSTIQQLSRALAESSNDVGSVQNLLQNLTRDTQTLLLQQSRVVTELQNGLMRTRMVPFSRHVQRLTRLVRQVATDTNKRVELQVSGASGEMDRQVLERMLPPFEHMLRNSVVHGIELPDVRRAAGKSETGVISVNLHREGSEMIIVLEDDGRGIDVNAVREQAKTRGLIQSGRTLTDEEALQLVLEPGFSTASTVTQYAGRGVGMDVVVTEIKKLGGALFTESVVGKGTRFTIRLPFTLAISQALIVRVGEHELYALPLPTVEGVVRLPSAEVAQHLQAEIPSYEYGGQLYRFQHLGLFLDAGPSILPDQEQLVAVVLIKAGEHSVALVTDELVGTREIVVKSVGPQIATVRGIAGATILGDGRIVIILDMGALVRSGWRTRATPQVRSHNADKRTLVLVVDDSITVRRVTQRFLERNGMRVITAKDGVDALELLQEQLPDIILLDIEMPRMDGYELATKVRSDPRLAEIPIVMITSRVSEKHRARAIEIGVNDYLGKPYQENQLLDAIDYLITAYRRSG